MSVRHLEALTAPSSIAVVSASDRTGSIGRVVVSNLRDGGFEGPVWPVNPRHDHVAGMQARPDVMSLPGTPDLAVICTPPDAVAGVMGCSRSETR